MQIIKMKPKEELAIRALLVRLNDDDMEVVYNTPFGRTLSKSEINRYENGLMHLKRTPTDEINDEYCDALREFVQRLTYEHAHEILSRPWAGKTLSKTRVEELRIAIFFFYMEHLKGDGSMLAAVQVRGLKQ